MNGREHRRARTIAASLLALAVLGGVMAGMGMSAWAQSAPAAATPSAESGPAAPVSAVPVRFGTHATFDRLVFDWPAAVPYTVEQQGNVLTVAFGAGGALNETQIAANLARVASGVAVAGDASGTRLTMQLSEGVRLRHFRSGTKLVFDFSRTSAPPPAEAAAAPPTASPATAEAARPWERLPLSRSTTPAPPPTPAETPAAPAPAAAGTATAPEMPPWVRGPAALAPPPAAASEPRAADVPAARPPRDQTPAEQAAALASVREQAAQEPQLVEQTRALARQIPAAPQATAAPTRLVPPPGTLSATPPAPQRAATTDAPASAEPRATAPTPAERSAAFEEARARRTATRSAAAERRALGPPVPVVRAEGHGLRFKWGDPVTAAAFTRGPYVFLVFNKRALLDLSAVRQPPPEDLVGDISEVPSDGTTLRLMPPANTYYAVRAEGNDWVVEMTRRPRRPDVPSEVKTRNESDPAAARVLVDLRGGESVLELKDPEVGDVLKIVPTPVAGAGVEDNHEFPQFRILASAQGLVVRPDVDDLVVRPLGGTVEIYAPKGLVLSPPDAVSPRADPSLDPEPLPRIFNFKEWGRDDGRPYLERKREMELALTAAPANNRNPARLALARFLLANGYAVEADGALETMVRQTPAIFNTRLYRALRGATALMIGNLEEASRNLRHASLDREPELAMWRVALSMAEGNPRGAIDQLSRGPDLTRDYPPPYNNRLGLAIAEALIELGDIPASRDRIEAVMASGPTPSEETQARYLRGRLAILEGKPDEARAIWSTLERNSLYSPAGVLASLALTDLELKENKLTRAEAADRIERLRYAWRGDDIEFAVLRRLGELELNGGDVPKGLARLRDLVELKPDSREVAAVSRQMLAAFRKFFLEGDADKMSPLAAIGLYHEFKDLIPAGPDADAMTRNLADRLIKVDLLDQAADLLENLIKTRLAGEAKAEAGARLAFTRLLDRKPEDALKALAETDQADISVDLVRDRNRLAARALADLERPAEALQKIADDFSSEGEVLRAEIHWKAESWAAAAEALAGLAGDPPAGETPMPDDQTARVLRYASALALAGDQVGLDVARAKYGAAMARSNFKDIFAVIASDAAGPMGDVRDIAARLASTAPFQTFLNAYRSRFNNTGPTRS